MWDAPYEEEPTAAPANAAAGARAVFPLRNKSVSKGREAYEQKGWWQAKKGFGEKDKRDEWFSTKWLGCFKKGLRRKGLEVKNKGWEMEVKKKGLEVKKKGLEAIKGLGG